MKIPSETLQYLPYFWNYKKVFFFISCYFIFSPNECLGLTRKIQLLEMKINDVVLIYYVDFLIPKKDRFCRAFHQAWTSFFCRHLHQRALCSYFSYKSQGDISAEQSFASLANNAFFGYRYLCDKLASWVIINDLSEKIQGLILHNMLTKSMVISGKDKLLDSFIHSTTTNKR